MSTKTEFTADEARAVGEQIGIDWATAPFDVEQFRLGMRVELEHGLHDPQMDVTGSDPIITGKIALAQPEGGPRLLQATRQDGSRTPTARVTRRTRTAAH